MAAPDAARGFLCIYVFMVGGTGHKRLTYVFNTCILCMYSMYVFYVCTLCMHSVYVFYEKEKEKETEKA